MATFYSTITFVFQCLFLTVVMASDLSAQSTRSVKEVEVKVEYSNDKLVQVFNDLEAKTNFSFVFDKKDKFLDERFNFSWKNTTVEELLIELSKQYQLKFKQVNNNITVNKNAEAGDVKVEIAIQTRTITGQVTESGTGEGLPGVNIIIKGTSRGTVTDVTGTYSIDVPNPETVLIFSSVGFVQEEVVVGDRSVIDLALVPDITALEEIVVIGYGTQQKKLITGATVNVDGEDLEKLSTTNALQALQGQTPGVNITSTSGQPGEGFKVNIRGVGTIGDASPLYIVDGMPVDDITYLNNADIASVDILKDAASAAIYGSRAANGVILITTRQGKAGKAQLTFDAYFGVQNIANPAEMLNSGEYATIMNEQAINSGKLPYFSNEEIAAMGEGTDWIDKMIVDDAITQNYSLGLQGGTEQSVYSTSFSYTQQEGGIGGKEFSNYERYNARLNSEHTLYDGLLKVGQNLTFSHIEQDGISVGGQYGNDLRGAFGTNPFIPMYDENGNFFDNSDSDWNNGAANPYAQMVYNNQGEGNSQKVVGNVYFELEPIKRLKLRSTLGIIYETSSDHSYTPVYQLSIYSFNDSSSVSQNASKDLTWIWGNVLSYGFDLSQHHIELMAGTEALSNRGSWFNAKNANLSFDDLKYAYLGNTTYQNGPLMGVDGEGYENFLQSYFGRVLYDFKETYLFNATVRYDGSSKFAEGNRWGFFPSVSAGWVLTNENFLAGLNGTVDFLKLRASWGQNGNQNIPSHYYLSTVAVANSNYIFGNEEGQLTPGAYPDRLPNEDLTWETSEQIDVGLDAEFLGSRLFANVDFYSKKTKDWLIQVPIPATAGGEPPYVNGGNVENKGVEVRLGWRERRGDFNYSISGNVAYNQNDITEIPTPDETIHGAANVLWNNSPEFYRAQAGYPVGYFWGYKTLGVFQNEQQIADYTHGEGGLIQPNAEPGDLIYYDANNDGSITSDDKVMIGDPNPDYTFGFNISADYKGFDISINANGVAGNQIVQSYRNHTDQNANYFKTILNRWHGEGTSNEIPRVTENSKNFVQFSDIYIQDGDFLRINNITIGYDFAKLIDRENFSQVRLFLTGQNLFTFTRYDGMDPEIGYGHDGGAMDSFSSGIDLGYYPRPRIYMAGLNVKF